MSREREDRRKSEDKAQLETDTDGQKNNRERETVYKGNCVRGENKEEESEKRKTCLPVIPLLCQTWVPATFKAQTENSVNQEKCGESGAPGTLRGNRKLQRETV